VRFFTQGNGHTEGKRKGTEGNEEKHHRATRVQNGSSIKGLGEKITGGSPKEGSSFFCP